MEEEKRIPLIIFDELAGVREVSLKTEVEGNIVLVPKLTEINHSYLKETSRVFFSKITKDFNKGIFDYFLFYQTIALHKKEEPSFFRTSINYFKKVKKIWDFIDTINSILKIGDYLGTKLSESKDKTKAQVGKKIRHILNPAMNLREKIRNLFSFRKLDMDNGVKPNTIKGKKPPKIVTDAPSFKRKKFMAIGGLLIAAGSMTVNKSNKIYKSDGSIDINALSNIDKQINENISFSGSEEKLQNLKFTYFSLLSSEYKKAGNSVFAYTVNPVNYDLEEMPQLEDFVLTTEERILQPFLPKSNNMLPWLKVWYNFLKIIKSGIEERANQQLYKNILFEFSEDNGDLISELNPDNDEILQIYAKSGEGKDLSIEDFNGALTLREVAEVSQKSTFDFKIEGKSLLDIKRKENDVQNEKWGHWVDILKGLKLKLNS